METKRSEGSMAGDGGNLPCRNRNTQFQDGRVLLACSAGILTRMTFMSSSLSAGFWKNAGAPARQSHLPPATRDPARSDRDGPSGLPRSRSNRLPLWKFHSYERAAVLVMRGPDQHRRRSPESYVLPSSVLL